jgi:secondary thiamine-phosphate synthase enzyme
MITKSMTTRTTNEGQIGQALETLVVETRGPGLSDQTAPVRAWLDRIGAGDGLLTLFIRHTSASLLIQENADPDVHTDLLDALERLAPRDHAYVHDVEGPDDMPAHIKSALTATSLSIPVKAGRMLLGTWQGIYVVEHRDRPHRREVVLHFIGALGG